jgi:hypothetical protein
MITEQVGSFRTRTTDDGSLEVWARGWRLESPLYALIPVGLALMFVLAPMPLPMRAGGAVVMLGAGLFVFRLQKPGLLFAEDAVTIVGVVRTRRYAWDGVSGFMGERRHDEGRVLLVLDGDVRVPLPGTLDPSELDPYGEEGETLSAVDQLNRLGERARAGQLPRPVAGAPKAPKVRKVPGVPKLKVPKIAVGEDPAPSSSPEPVAPTTSVATATTDLMERPAPPSNGGNHPFVVKAPEPPEDAGPATRKQRRADRRELRRALKAVQITKDGRAILPPPTSSGDEAVADPEAAPTPAPRRAPARKPAPDDERSSHYPQPTYIPQEEYARMLREQRAAEKAAAAAAAELRELADPDELSDPVAQEPGGGWSR